MDMASLFGKPGEEIPARFVLPRPIYGQIVQHLERVLPEEGCGLLAGEVDGSCLLAARFYPGENADHSPTRYTMEPAQVIDAFRMMRQSNEELLAIVHSHPVSPPRPSPTDLAEAYYPEALMIIVSFAAAPELRAWRIDMTTAPLQIAEIEVNVV